MNFFLLLLGNIFKSIRPTVDAFCGKKIESIPIFFIKLFFTKNFLNSSTIYFPLFNSKADSPIITIGFFEDSNFLENSTSLFKIFFISSVELPIIE